MKRILFVGLVFLFSLLVGCASSYFGTPTIQERWMSQLQYNPSFWARNAGNWFLRGDFRRAELMTRRAPYTSAISTMTVNVPNFTNIRVEGAFQVELFGGVRQNSVYVLGSNAAVRDIAIEVRNNTLYVRQMLPFPMVRNVIVRIGVCNLRRLIQYGSGRVEGINLRSTNLKVISRGAGNMFLSGELRLTKVIRSGCGSVNIFGVNTPYLDISSVGAGGEINLTGNVGLQTIFYLGNGNVNIIGAYSRGLRIYAEGTGKIGIVGGNNPMGLNLTDVCTKLQARVFVCGVTTNNLNVYTYSTSTVGVAGFANNLSVHAYDKSCFLGQHLCTRNAYVKTFNQAHANVAANGKAFINANQNSGAYFFGPMRILDPFVTGNANIIPIYSDASRICRMPTTPIFMAPPPVVQAAPLPPPRPRPPRKFTPWVNRPGEG